MSDIYTLAGLLVQQINEVEHLKPQEKATLVTGVHVGVQVITDLGRIATSLERLADAAERLANQAISQLPDGK